MQIRKFAFAVLVTSFGFLGCGQPDEVDLTPGLKLEISAPADSVYTNGSVTIQVVVTEGTAERVVLEKDGEPLVNLDPPYQYTWDTSREPEGMYALRARAIAGEVSAESSIRNVVVDRTAPTVVSRLPLPGSSYACGDVPAHIEFSEPIQTANVSDGSFGLENATGAFPVTVTWSKERTGVTVAPQRRLEIGESVSLRIDAALTDLAGNALRSPDGAWTWESPEFCSTTGATPLIANHVVDEQDEARRWLTDITLDDERAPVVVWSQLEPCKTFMRRWRDNRWTPAALVSTACWQPQVRFGDGSLHVAQPSSEMEVYLLREAEGGVWEPVGGAVNIDPTVDGIGPSVVFNDSGRPIITWWERSAGSPVYAKWWDGSAWTSLGGRIGQLHQWYSSPSIAINAQGLPMVAFVEVTDGRSSTVVKHWDGWNWSTMGSVSPLASNAQLVNRGGVPYLAFEELHRGGPITVMSWDGTAWVQLGDNSQLGAGGAGDLSMVVGNWGRPAVAYTEKVGDGATEVHVKQWNGAEWVSIGGPFAVKPNASRSRPGIVFAASEDPIVTVLEETSEGAWDVFVWRRNE